MFFNFNEEVKKCLINSKKEMRKLKHTYIGTEHLMLSVLSNNNLYVTKILNKQGVNYSNFKTNILQNKGEGKDVSEYFLYTPLLKRIIEEAMLKAKENNGKLMTVEDLISCLIEQEEGDAIRILLCMNIDIDKLLQEIYKNNSKKKNYQKKRKLVEEYGYNMSEKAAKQEIDPVIGREKEINRMVEILCRRTKNNPLLIGEAGVGKTAIVEELSRRIAQGTIPEKLKDKKIIAVSMANLIAGTKYRGEFEERITKILNELEDSPEIILFVDEIHTLIGAGGAEGAIDASNILKPFLARGKLKLIGATTTDEYKKYLEDDRALDRRFQTILIRQPSKKQVLEILTKLKPIYEGYHNVIIENKLLKNIVELSEKYIYNRNEPDKSIDILDEVCSRESLVKNRNNINLDKLNEELNKILKKKNDHIIKHNFAMAAELKKKENKLLVEINKLKFNNSISGNKKRVKLKTLAEVIRSKSNIPVYEILKEDFNKINKMEVELSKTVIGQEKVVFTLSKEIKRIKLGYKFENRPRAYFFVGPTGVGKTLLAKELNKIIGSEDNLIRLDMSEYKEEHSVSKIIGAPPGYVGFLNKNTVLDEVKRKPNAIILLDEIERAHSSVINLFLQILDEGKIRAATNDIVRFDNTIIIMTSNIGFTKNNIGFNSDMEKTINSKLIDMLGIALVNRLDRIFIFDRLDEKSIKKIINSKIENLKKNFELKELEFKINKNLINKIIKKSKYQEYGARKVDKLLKNELIDIIINKKIKSKETLIKETI